MVRKIKKSVRLSAEHLDYIMTQKDSDNFSESLEWLIEKAKLQDEFLNKLAIKNQFVRIAKKSKNTLEASNRVMDKNNQMLEKTINRILFHFKERKEVTEYYEQLKQLKSESRTN